jgi:hypothetical protein
MIFCILHESLIMQKGFCVTEFRMTGLIIYYFWDFTFQSADLSWGREREREPALQFFAIISVELEYPLGYDIRFGPRSQYKYTEHVGWSVALLTSIRNVLSSNLRPGIDFTHWDLPWFFCSPSRQEIFVIALPTAATSFLYTLSNSLIIIIIIIIMY